MKKNYPLVTIIGLVSVTVLGLGIYLLGNSGGRRNGLNNSLTASVAGAGGSQISTTGARQLFSSSPLAPNAYLISGTTLDANAQTALSGFNVVRNVLADGSTQITLNAQNPGYTTQTYNVKPGEKLYFIEKMLGDDSGDKDKFLGDDQAVLVDADGYIIQE